MAGKSRVGCRGFVKVCSWFDSEQRLWELIIFFLVANKNDYFSPYLRRSKIPSTKVYLTKYILFPDLNLSNFDSTFPLGQKLAEQVQSSFP